jgi:hypothetical protein
VRVHELEKFVLITHYGCAYYGQRLNKPPQECLQAQHNDLRIAMDTLRGWYPHISVESYLAMRHGRILSFHPLT